MGNQNQGYQRMDRRHNTIIPVEGDHLSFKHDKLIMNQLDHSELLMYSTEVQKKNRFGQW